MDADAQFSALLEDSADELYDEAPCGYLSTLLDGTIAKINATLLDWLGRSREQMVGKARFADLLTIGGRLYHETHFAPLLQMHGEVNGIALELLAADGTRRPVLVSSRVKTGEDGQPLLIRTSVFDARERRAYETELLRARHEAEQARRAAEGDRARLKDVLAVLQQSLLPPVLSPIPGLQTASYYHTASPDLLGGDFYDLFPLGRERWGFFLGDVCGKGPAAAAVTSLARHVLRAAALNDPPPESVLGTLHTVLSQRYTGDDARFCTVLYGTLQPVADGYALTVTGGGHPPLLVLRADGTAHVLPTPAGQLVGILPDPRFTTARTVLAPGDTVLAYTDGLTEARTGAGAGVGEPLYGQEALLDFAARLAPASAAETVDALAVLLDGFGDGLSDDTALLAVGVPREAGTGAGPADRAESESEAAASDGEGDGA